MRRDRLTANAALLVSLGLLVAVLATYARSLTNAPVWDDGPLVVDNPFLGSFSGLARLWSTDLFSTSAQGDASSYYRPFPMFTFWVNVAIGGRSPASLRLGNVLIHAVNAMLLALLARKAYGLGPRSAGLVALVFALAPVCSEPVLYVAARFDLLVVTFALLALLASRIEGTRGKVLCLAAVAAGLVCKESFIGWLPLLLLDDVFVRRIPVRRLVGKYVAIAAVGGAYLALRRVIGIPSLDVVTHTGVRALAESFLFLVGSFLRELVWPTRLDPFRPYSIPSVGYLVASAMVLAGLVAAPIVTSWRRHDSVAARVAIFGVAWFVLATLPSAVVGPTLAIVGDRYAYLPLVGVFIAAMGVVAEIAIHAPRALRVAGVLASVVAVAFGISTALHGRDWRDAGALAESSLASDPENPYALYLLGSDAALKGQLDKADDLLGRSMANNPGSWRTWNAVCYLRLHQDRLVEAERSCKQAIQLLPLNPRAWLNLASVYVTAQRWSEALTAADHTLALKPDSAEAHYLAGVSAANLGLIPVALAHVQAGLVAEPTHARLLSFKADLERYQLTHPSP
ncbi:MAG: Tetratricopeptide repeat protein [Myxococcaceae bacterium]|nr:Tetratricopeptide repeat protein [Myxococcaceae bacterium]